MECMLAQAGQPFSDLDFRDFTRRTALARFEKKGDLLGDLFTAPQPLENAVARLEPLLK